MAVDANAWTTLNSVKSHLHIGISDTHCDEFLESLINIAYKRIERHIGRQVKEKQYTEYYNGDGTNRLVLRRWPVTSVTSVKMGPYGDITNMVDVSNLDYFIDLDPDSSIGVIEIAQSMNSISPSYFEIGIRNVRVVYNAGWTVVPNDLKHALNMHVAWLFRRAGTEATRAQSLGGKSESYEDTDFPPYIKQFLDPYKERTS